MFIGVANLIGLAALLQAPATPSLPTTRQTDLQAKIDGLLANTALQGATVACLVEDTNGHVLYSKNPLTRVLPASNEKLVTATFALAKLGPQYQCQLAFWKEKDGLVVRATGDPLLSKPTLLALKHQLNPENKTVFLSEAYAPGFNEFWELGDLPNRYSAPVTALTLDRGGLELWAMNGRLQLRPDPFDLRTKYSPSSGPPKTTFDVFRKQVLVTGILPAGESRLDTLCLPEPDLEAASYLGAKVVRRQSLPKRNPDFVASGSKLTDLLHLCLQNSDNDIAENFLLMAASQGNDIDPPYPQALKALSAFLQDSIGLGQDKLRPADGSGLARWNFVTVTGIAEILKWNLKQPTADLWCDSLDRPGLGTLVSRLPGVRFRGKTGTLTGVSALSGYLDIGNGKTYIVSFVANNFLVPTSVVKALEDQLILTLKEDLSSSAPTNGTGIADRG